MGHWRPPPRRSRVCGLSERAATLGVPIYLHPQMPSQDVRRLYYDGYGDVVSGYFASGGWGWHMETGIEAVRLILAGTFLPRLAEGGTVVIIGSTASTKAEYGVSLYVGSKAALRQFVRGWISEVKKRGIRINVLSPGAIDTPSLRTALAGASGEENVEREVKRMGEGNPLGRLGDSARDRQGGRLPVERRLELRHRHRAVRRRWHGANRLARD